MKISMIVNGDLSAGQAANCAAVLGISLGGKHPDIIGPELEDASGFRYPGITGISIPVLKASGNDLRRILNCAALDPGLEYVVFTDTAQRCHEYGEYRARLEAHGSEAVVVLGLCLIGVRAAVVGLTRALPLYGQEAR